MGDNPGQDDMRVGERHGRKGVYNAEKEEKLESDAAALVLGQFFFKYSLTPTNSWHSYKSVRCLSMKTGKTQQ